jgi:hypothetical protein
MTSRNKNGGARFGGRSFCLIEVIEAGEARNFLPATVLSVPHLFCGKVRYAESLELATGLKAMRVMIICALLISATLGLGGCWWHHQAAVVSEPAPPLK